MKTAIAFSFVFLTVYAVFALFGFLPGALFLGTSSPMMILYVVYKVLRDPHEAEGTFEESFYQDHPYRRNLIAIPSEEED